MSLRILLVLMMLLSFFVVSCNQGTSPNENTNDSADGTDVDGKGVQASGDWIYFKNATSNEVNLTVRWSQYSADLESGECLSVPKSDIQSAIDSDSFGLKIDFYFGLLGRALCSIGKRVASGQNLQPADEQSINCEQVQNFVITSIDKPYAMDDYARQTELSDNDKTNCKTYEDYKTGKDEKEKAAVEEKSDE